MRTTRWLGAAALLFSGIALTAQQAGVSAQQSTSAGPRTSENAGANASAQAHPGGASAGGSASGAASTGHGTTVAASEASGDYSAANLRSVSGELQGKLDAKTAKIGDPVILKTSQKVKTADGTVIPKGTRLMGHVTSVQAHDSAHAQSELGLVFDRAVLKDGQSVAVHSMIRSVGTRMNPFAEDSMAQDDSLASASSGIAGGGARAGSLANNSPLAGAINVAGNAAAQTDTGLTSAADGTIHSAGDVAGHTAGGLGADTRAAGSVAGGVGAHATNLPGVMLEGGASDSFSGILTASRKNVHLDNGTEMELGIVTAARQ